MYASLTVRRVIEEKQSGDVAHMLLMTFVFFWYLASLLKFSFNLYIFHAFNCDDLHIEHNELGRTDCACASHIAVLIGGIQSLYLEPD